MLQSATIALAAVLLPTLGAADGPVAWHIDLASARAEALQSGKPLLFVVHQAGEPGNEDMLRSVYANPRFAKAVQNAVPVLVYCADPNLTEQGDSGFGIAVEELGHAEPALRTFLFGDATVLTPQHILLDPDGGVLWHNVRVCSLSTLLRGIDSACVALRQGTKARLRLARIDAVALARRAAAEPEAETKLALLLRHSADEDLAALLDAVCRDQASAETWLRTATVGLATEDGARRLAIARGSAAPMVRAAIDQVAGEIATASQSAPAVDVAEGPRPVLGQLRSFGSARFADDAERVPSNEQGELTVLWFFLPDDQSLGEQARRLTPLVQELAGKGVRFLGLGGSLDPESALARAAEFGLPFPVATYVYDSDQAFAEVAMFPGVLILDAAGNILYRASDDAMAADFLAFAPTLRGLLAANATRG